MVRVRPSGGMSLIEILICITILAILSGGAYMSYLDHVKGMKTIVGQSNLRKIGEAVQAFNSQNAEPYATSDPKQLVGPYLAELPLDPWGNDFLIDFFFGRAISPGQDMKIDTFCPFPLFHAQVRTVPNSDDLTVDYQQQGKLGCVRGQPGGLWQMRPDGSMASELESNNVLGADQTGNGTLVLYCLSGSGFVKFLSMTEEPYVVDLPLPTVPAGLNTPTRVAWAPDCVRYAAIAATNAGTSSVITVGQTTGTEQSFVMATAPAGTVFESLAWAADGRQLVCTVLGVPALESNLWIGTVGQGSTLSVVTTDAVSIRHATCSPDGRWYAYQTVTNLVKVVNAATRDVLVTVANASHPTFSPDSRKVAWGATAGTAMFQIRALHLSMVRPGMTPPQVEDICVQLSVFPPVPPPPPLAWLSWD